ncbi:MAG: acetyltransferase [Alphaproteobacteria bacterium]|nr:acetyltransferase [Alphaproteobacteria bacterium]
MTSKAAVSKKVVIFGNGKFAELVGYLVQQDSEYEVVAFTVDRPFIDSDRLLDVPVIAFDEVTDHFPPESYQMLVALGYLQVNGLRERKYTEAKELGYQFISYVSSRASTWPNVHIGENCIIFEQAVLQPFSSLGDNVIVRSSAHVSHHVRVANHAFISAGVTIGGGTTISEFSFVGLNATVRDNITIGPKCFVAAGAAVIADTEDDGLYIGVPAKRHPKPASTMDL